MPLRMKLKSIAFSRLFLLLLSLSCVDGHLTLYVKPGHPADPPCPCPPNEVCESLEFYTLEDTGDNVTLIFLCGYHTLETLRNSTTEVRDIHYLNIQGRSHEGVSDPSRNVIIYGIQLIVRNVSEVHLSNVTINDTTFKVYPKSMDDRVTFNMSNCHFFGSDCLIISADMTIRDSSIVNGTNTAFNLIQSTLTLAGDVEFRGNTGEKGGALALVSTELNISRNANVTFSDNYAISKGGAIYVNNPTEVVKVFPTSDCFYHLLQYDENASYNVNFVNNHAVNGGSHIFGAPLRSDCTAAVTESGDKIPSYKIINSSQVFHFDDPGLSNNSKDSAVTSSPSRLCLCDKSGTPQCVDQNKIFVFNITHYPGEFFSLSAVLVGADFGPTIGIVHAHLFPDQSLPGEQPHLEQRGQTIMKTKCATLNYAVYSKHYGTHMMTLSAVKSNLVRIRNFTRSQMIDIYNDTKESINKYYEEGVIDGDIIFTPLYVHVNLEKCPPGFTLSNRTSAGCTIYKSLSSAGVKSNLSYPGGYLSHQYWIGAKIDNQSTEIILSRYCPLSLCNVTATEIYVNVQNDTSIDSQCAFNRAGRFCGGCEDSYSLAIGSMHCIKCDNNNNLSLLIVFALFGFLLVIFVTVFDLTITQGMVNGVIFYANIIWVYEDILFPQQSTDMPSLQFLRIFIAWLNLDFGIEMCFVVGLDAFWKTLLQYVFPLYIWSIVGVIILVARHSIRLTKLLGSRAVSVLSSLILLSYMNLLRNAVTTMQYATLDYYNSTSNGTVHSTIVWAVDGQLDYLRSPKHIILFCFALVVLLVGLPFTLVLLLGQWLRRLSFFSRFHPIFDSYYAPIKANHHYWLGLLLFTRILIYLLNFNLFAKQGTFSLLVTIVILFTYMSFVRPLQSMVNFVFYSTFLINLIIVSGSFLFTASYEEKETKKYYITIVSTGIAFVEFCLLVIVRIIKTLPFGSICNRCRRCKYKEIDPKEQESSPTNNEVVITNSYSTYRDSILEESSLSLVVQSF